MGQDSDPVGNGFVTSLARPGGNISGLSSLTPEISGKRLELLKETIPKLSRVAVLGNSAVPENAQASKETEIAAGALGIKLQYLDVRDSKDIGAAFQAASKGRVDAVLALPGPVLFSQRKQVADIAVKGRLPAIYWTQQFVDAGSLMSYGTNLPDLFRRSLSSSST